MYRSVPVAVERRRGRGWIPPVLSLAMLATVVASALAPSVAGIPADTSCPYGACPSTNSSNSPLLLQLTLAILVIIAIALAVIVWSRSRRGGGPGGPVAAWSGGQPPSGAAGETPEVEPTGESVEESAVPAGVAGGAAGAAAAYVETEADVGAAPPEVPTPPPAAAPGGEADIDSLMQELDKISNEILKRRGPKTGAPGEGDSAGEPSDDTGSSN